MISKLFCRFEGVNAPRWSAALCLTSLLLFSLLIRFAGIDHGVSFHPDERGIILAALDLSWSDLNPNASNYGSLTYYLLWFTVQFTSWISHTQPSYDSFFMVARTISVLASTLAILLTYSLTKHLFRSTSLALLAATLLAFNPLHYQLSHFYTPDILLTTAVIAFFLCLSHFAEKPSRIREVLLGAIAGIAFGFKVSAITLILPWLFVCICLFRRGRSFSRSSIGAILFLGALVISTATFQPFLFLEPEAYWHGLSEQLRMIRGEWKPPYSLQFEHTTAYLYPLAQMWKYTITPPIVCLFLIGIPVTFLARSLRRNSALVALVLWSLFLFIQTGISFAKFPADLYPSLKDIPLYPVLNYVKFPRYLLPLYPTVAILAALSIRMIYRATPSRSRFRRALVPAGIVLWPVLATFALLTIYVNPHIYEIASHWIVANVPARSTLAHSHWDDTLPVRVVGSEQAAFQVGGEHYTLPLFEGDTNEKLEQVASILSRSDYLIFPTQRAYQPILNTSDRYPKTATLLSLLFQEKLGFQLERTFRVIPHIGPFAFRDLLANESLVTYDHPKVMIFKNTFRYPPKRIADLVTQPPQSFQLITAHEALALERRGPESEYTLLPSSLLSAMILFLGVQLLGFMALPLTLRVFKKLPDYGYGAAKILGILLATFPAWLLSVHFSVPLGRTTLLLCLLGALLFSFSLRLPQIPQRRRKLFFKLALRNEVLFSSVFALFLVIRSFHPEIFWGEKTMDFSFLNYFSRVLSMPPEDPWAATQPLSYYYFGYYTFAKLLLLLGIDTSVGYNLVMALLPSLLVAVTYSILSALIASRLFVTIGSLAIPLFSNLEFLYLWIFGGSPTPQEPVKLWSLNFDLFWRSARAYTPQAITEYPVWAFLFNDLHPHVMVYPFVGLFLLCCVALPSRISRHNFAIPLTLLTGMVLGTLFAMNSWDFLTYSLLLSILFVFRIVDGISKAQFKARLGTSIFQGLFISIAALSFFSPFFFSLSGGRAFHWGWNQPSEFDNIFLVLRMHGVFLIPLLSAAALFLLYSKNYPQLRKMYLSSLFTILIGALPFLPLFFINREYFPIPLGIIVLSSLLLLIAGSSLPATFRGKQLLPLAAIATAALLISGMEYFFFLDRMNTVFKFNNAVWILLGTGAIWFSASMFRIRGTRAWSLRAISVYLFLGVPKMLLLIQEYMEASSNDFSRRKAEPWRVGRGPSM